MHASLLTCVLVVFFPGVAPWDYMLRLREAQLGTIQKLWRRAASTTAEGRAGLPDRNDRAWFSSTFCDGADLSSVDVNTPIWPFVASFNRSPTDSAWQGHSARGRAYATSTPATAFMAAHTAHLRASSL